MIELLKAILTGAAALIIALAFIVFILRVIGWLNSLVHMRDYE